MPLRIAGGVALAGAGGAGVGAILAWQDAEAKYARWETKDAQAKHAGGSQSAADTYYDEVFVPAANTMVGLGVAAGVLVAAGVVLEIVDLPGAGSATIVPAAGGGLLQWSASF